MRFKKTLILAISVIAAQSSYAQYETDALRFSQFKNSSTARFDAMGGSKTAVGGDLSSLYGNPAGIGMFTKSDFSITPGLKLRDNSISINGTNNSITGSNADLNNVGVVFNTKTYKTGDLQEGILSLSFGIGYQKKGSYTNEFNFDNATSGNGLGLFLTEAANKEKVAAVDKLTNLTYYAFNSYVIDQDGNSNPVVFKNLTGVTANQAQIIKRSGGSSSIDFSLGMNISNQLFLGGSIGLASFRYTATESINEYGSLNNTDPNTYNIDYIRNYDTEGSGINLKIGAILRPTQELSLGLNFESPTWYSITDNFSEDFNNKNKASFSGTDEYDLDYNLRTPLKLNGGISYFFDKKGFISADFGFTNYSTIKFTSDITSLNKSSNKDITNLYKTAINASVGGEIKLTNQFLLRAGYQFQGNPYKGRSNKDYSTDAISGGIGYRFGTYYLDLSLVNSNNTIDYSGYKLNAQNQPTAIIETRHNDIALTFGVRF